MLCRSRLLFEVATVKNKDEVPWPHCDFNAGVSDDKLMYCLQVCIFHTQEEGENVV